MTPSFTTNSPPPPPPAAPPADPLIHPAFTPDSPRMTLHLLHMLRSEEASPLGEPSPRGRRSPAAITAQRPWPPRRASMTTVSLESALPAPGLPEGVEVDRI